MTDNRASNIDISMIIPVYNTSKFLKECIDSLFSQTIAQRIQYVFINDASTDCSLQLLQKHKAKHPFLNIVVISNQKNSGSATTRNTGTKHAEGKYLMFVDSDDWIEPNMACLLQIPPFLISASIAALKISVVPNRSLFASM